MSSSNVLSAKRLWMTMKIDIVQYNKILLVAAAAILVISVMLPVQLFSSSADLILYYLLLNGVGLIITGQIFSDFHEEASAQSALLLPCSNIERWLSRWLISVVGVAVFTLVCFIGSMLVATAIHSLIYGQNMMGIHWLSPNLLTIFRDYILIQSLFFFGAIYFSSYNVVKTTLVIGCFWAVVNILVGVLFVSSIPPDYLANFKAHRLVQIYFTIKCIAAPLALYFSYRYLSRAEL